MFDFQKIADNDLDGFDCEECTNNIDILVVNRWTYVLRSVSITILIFGIAQTCMNSKLVYIYVLLGLLLMASIADIISSIFMNWYLFEYYKRTDENKNDFLHTIENTNAMNIIFE